MNLTSKDLEHLEVLSRIKIADSKRKEYLAKLEHVLAYIGQLARIKTEGIKPTSQVTNLENVLRDDVVGQSFTQEEALKNSKHIYKGYFKLPKVVE